MCYQERRAKVNVKLLVILMLVMVALGISLVAARQVRRRILSKVELDKGIAAFEEKDWKAACRHLQEYLGRNSDDVDILKKYAQARLSIRPMEVPNIMHAIAAHRQVLQLNPLDAEAYDALVTEYTVIGNFEEVAHITRMRLNHVPEDHDASLRLTQALIQLNKTEEARQKLEALTTVLEALPDKQAEYVKACGQLSHICSNEDSPTAHRQALEWLNDAVAYASQSAEAAANRARFYRQAASSLEDTVQKQLLDLVRDDLEAANIDATTAPEQLLALARRDLEAADDCSPEDPRTRFFLGTEWIAHGELGRAADELQAIEKLPQETLEEYFFDINNWVVRRFLLASELAIRRGDVLEGASLADEALNTLQAKRHRVQVLPLAVRFYVATGAPAKARASLDEYVDILYTQQGASGARFELAYLQASVASVEDRPYVVIGILQPFTVSDASRPDLWRLLAGAYSQSGQPRRAADALTKYLRLRPDDLLMKRQMAKEYCEFGDWRKALEISQTVENADAGDLTAKLLRIETSLHVAAQGPQGPDTAKLEELSGELSQLRGAHPERVDIRIAQVAIALYLGQLDEAEKELLLAIEQCETPLPAEMQLARYYQRRGRTAEALRVYQESCKRHPEVAEPWLSLGNLHMANADYDAGRKSLKQGLESVTGKQEERSLAVRLAVLEVLSGDRVAGIGMLRQLAADNKYDIHVRSLLLGIPEIRNDRAAASELIGQLRSIEGEGGLMWRLHQASLWLASDEWRLRQKDVAEMLQLCMDADPLWEMPALLLAGMYEDLKNVKQAEDVCRRALAHNPGATAIADKLLGLLGNQGRFSEAEQILQQLETSPKFASDWRVRMALGKGDASRAIDELRLRVSSGDKDARSLVQLARLVYAETGNMEETFRNLDEAEALAPGSRMITAVRVAILKEEGRADEARGILDQYVAKRQDFDSYWMRAVYFAEEGEPELAEQDYKKLATFTDRGVDASLLLSSFYAGNGKIEEAVAAAEEGVDLYAENLRLERRLMQLLMTRGRPGDRERALKILEALEKKLPKDIEVLKLRAVHLLEDSAAPSVEAAREKLQAVVKLEPRAVDAHLMLINLAMREGKFETARDHAVQALGSNPDNGELLAARARAELTLDNAQMAVELARRVVAADPDNRNALSVMVDAALVKEDNDLLEETRALIDSALQSGSDAEDLLVARAQVLGALKMYEAAIPELEAYSQTEEGQGSLRVIVTLADLYRLTGKLDRSARKIELAERIDPTDQAVVHARVLWLMTQNRFGELEGISSAYLSAQEQNPSIVIKGALALAAVDSIQIKKEAVKLFEQAVVLAPSSTVARMGLAFTLYQTGDVERAKAAYEELLRQDRGNVRVLNDLAWILQEHYREYRNALDLADKGLMLAPDDLHLIHTRGVILSKLVGRLTDAKTDFELLVRLSPENSDRQAEALLELGRVCAKLNENEEARQHLQRALEIDGEIKVFTPEERSEIANLMQQSGM